MVKEIAFTAYPAKDVAYLRNWYQTTLGIPFDNPFIQDGIEQYNEANVAGGFFSLMNHEWMECEPGVGTGVAFEVADLDRAIAGLRTLGVDVGEPYVTPVCKLASLRDPEGNKITLHQITVAH